MHLTCFHVRQVAVHVIRHDAFERDIPVFHDDVNWWNRLVCVAIQGRCTVDRSESSDPNAIIEWGERENLDSVLNALDTFDALHYSLGVILENWFRDLSGQNDRPVIDLVCQVVEN